MKTFLTEKHNIPEGATHYQDESSSRHFAWFKDMNNDVCKIMTHHSDKWRDVETKRYGLHAKPIPQTKEVEWGNGDKCVYMNSKDLHIVIGYDNEIKEAVWCKSLRGDLNLLEAKHLSKPESPEAKKEREIEELSDLACESLFGESIQNCRPDVAATVRCMIEGGYRNDKVNNKKSTLY